MAKFDIFYDEHAVLSQVDLLGSTVLQHSSCQAVFHQIYTCGGGTIDTFTITANLTPATANGHSATIAAITKQ